MKVDKVVKKETLNIALGVLGFSLITQIVFLICGKYSFPVLLGSIYGAGIAILNFFLMGLSVQNITQIEDANYAKKKMQFSYSLRQLLLLFLVGAGMYISSNFGTFHWMPILLAVIYPRLTIAIMGFYRKKSQANREDVS